MRSGPIFLLAVVGVAVAGAAAVAWVAGPGAAPPGEPIALSVSDVTVVGGERIRLVGYDTSEVTDPRCSEEEQLGRFAAASLEGMLRGAGTIELTPEPGRDAYGRRLGRIEVDRRDVGARLVMRGRARRYEDRPRGNWCP